MIIKNKTILFLFLFLILLLLIIIYRKKNLDFFEAEISFIPNDPNNINLVLFHSGFDICGGCKKLYNIIEYFKDNTINNKTIKLHKPNCLCESTTNKNKVICDVSKHLCETNKILNFPTLYLFKHDKTKVKYNSSNLTKQSIEKWLKQNI